MNFSQKDIVNFWEKVDIKGEDECWNWLAGLNKKKGYGRFWLNGKNESAHCCSLILAHAAQPLNKTWVLHTCIRNSICVNPNHLYYGDVQDNSNDQTKDNTQSKGERHGLSKLTEVEVREIRQKYIPHKYTHKKLAKEYGVDKSQITRIINCETWKHVK